MALSGAVRWDRKERRPRLPSAAATCIGPVSLVTINSLERIHSTISGRESWPVRSRHCRSAWAIRSPRGRSSGPPRTAKPQVRPADGQLSCQFAIVFNRPALVGPARAGLDQYPAMGFDGPLSANGTGHIGAFRQPIEITMHRHADHAAARSGTSPPRVFGRSGAGTMMS